MDYQPGQGVGMTFFDEQQNTRAVSNLLEQAGLTSDQAAEAHALSRTLGEPPATDAITLAEARDRVAVQTATGKMRGSPTLRTILADHQLAQLIKDSPQDWDALSELDQRAVDVKQGLLQGDMADAWRRLRASLQETPRVDVVEAYYGDEIEALRASGALGDEEIDRLRHWASVTDSPLIASRRHALDERIAAEERARAEEARYAPEEIAQAQIDLNRLPQNTAMRRMQDAQTWNERLSLAFQNPGDVVLSAGLSSAAMDPGALLLAPAVGLAGSVSGVSAAVGAGGVLGASSFANEFGATLTDLLAKRGVDLSNPDAIRTALSNGELRKQLFALASQRAFAVSSFDAITTMLGGAQLRPATSLMNLSRSARATREAAAQIAERQTANRGGALINAPIRAGQTLADVEFRPVSPTARVVEDAVWQAVLQSGGGAAGEALGQAVAGQEYNPADIFLEAIAEFSTAPVDVLSARAEIKTLAEHAKQAARANDTAQKLEAGFQTATQAPLMQKAPDVALEAVQRAFSDTPLATLSVSAMDVSDYVREIRAVAPAVADAIEKQAATGGDVDVQISELFRIRLANESVGHRLFDAARVNNEAMSLEEAQAFAGGFDRDLNDKVEKAVTAAVDSQARRAECAARSRAAFAEVRRTLVEGGDTEAAADNKVAMLASVLENLSETLGVDPMAFFDANRLRIVKSDAAPEVGGFHQTGRLYTAGGAPSRRRKLDQADGTNTEETELVAEGTSENVASGTVAEGGTTASGTIEEVSPTGEARERPLGGLESPLTREGEKALADRKNRIYGAFKPEERLITLFKEADASTFVHESAHYWLDTMMRVMNDIAVEGRTLSIGEQRFYDTMVDFMRWGGVLEDGESVPVAVARWLASGEDGQRAFQEKFAEGFESYMERGEAPSQSLQTMFDRFKAWLKTAYANLSRRAPGDISPEVAALYDRLFSSEEAAAQNEAEAPIPPSFADYLATVASPEDIEAFDALRRLDRGFVEAQVSAAQGRDARIGHNARARAARDLDKVFKSYVERHEQDIKNSPAFVVLNMLRNGRKEGDRTITVRLRESSLQGLSREDYDFLRRRHWIAKDDAQGVQLLTLDEIATMMPDAFEDGTAVLDQLKEFGSADIRTIAENLARNDFLSEYGEAYTPEGVAKLAAAATQNDFHLRTLSTAYVALRKSMGAQGRILAATRAMAADIVARQAAGWRTPRGNWGFISPGRTEQTARRLEKQAWRRFAEGDINGAADLLQAAMIQGCIAAELRRGREDINRFRRRVTAAEKSKTVFGTHHVQIANAARALGFNVKNYPREPKLENFVKRHPRVGVAWQKLSEEAKASLVGTGSPWQLLSVSDIRDLSAFFTVLAKDGRYATNMNEAQAKADALHALSRMTTSVVATAANRGRKPVEVTSTETEWTDRLRRALSSYFFWDHLRAGNAAEMMDGNKQGVVTEELIYTADECGNREVELNGTVGEELTEAMRPLFRNLNGGKFRDGKGRLYNRHNLFAILLYWGSETGRERLSKNHKLTQADIEAFARQLTSDELQAINNIWAVFAKTKTLAAEVERRMNGFEPDWIDPLAFTVVAADGTRVELTGGYIPIKYDRVQSRGSGNFNKLQSLESNALQAGITSSTTSRSYLKKRMDSVEEGLQLKLDLNGITTGLNEVIHDVCWREWAARTKRIFDGGFRIEADGEAMSVSGFLDVVRDTWGAEAAEVYQKWFDACIRNGRSLEDHPLDTAASWIRQGVSIAGLGLNLMTALVQATGLMVAATRVGPRHLLSGIGDCISSPATLRRTIREKSRLMQSRGVTRTREINDVRNRIDGGRYAEVRNKIYDLAYAPMLIVQGFIDHAVWAGAYREAITDGKSEAQAVQYADRTVIDTQGSGMVKDRAAIENGGPVQKLFTVFYSFMGTAFGLNASSLLGESNRLKAAMQIATIGMVMPCIEAVLRSALAPGGGDEWERMSDEEKTVKSLRFVAGTTLGFATGQIIGLREISGAIENAVKGDPVFSYRGPSGLRVLVDTTTLMQQAQQRQFDLAFAKACVNVLGATGTVPSSQIIRTATGWDAYKSGRTDNILALLFGYKE